MKTEKTRPIATIVLANFLAIAAGAAENGHAPLETTEAPPAAAEHEAADAKAVEDAIEAVLAENRLELEIRLNGRTSETVVEGP